VTLTATAADRYFFDKTQRDIFHRRRRTYQIIKVLF